MRVLIQGREIGLTVMCTLDTKKALDYVTWAFPLMYWKGQDLSLNGISEPGLKFLR